MAAVAWRSGSPGRQKDPCARRGVRPGCRGLHALHMRRPGQAGPGGDLEARRSGRVRGWMQFFAEQRVDDCVEFVGPLCSRCGELLSQARLRSRVSAKSASPVPVAAEVPMTGTPHAPASWGGPRRSMAWMSSPRPGTETTTVGLGQLGDLHLPPGLRLLSPPVRRPSPSRRAPIRRRTWPGPGLAGQRAEQVTG